MKKTFIVILILFTLTACGASNAMQTSNGNNNNSSGGASLPLATELLVGTFKLEGTANAVTADQAAQLIPLWQVYKDLSASSSAAQEEITALAGQIQGTMTPQQFQAITDMKLTSRDVYQTMQDLGITSTTGGGSGSNSSGTPRAGGGGNNFGGGGGGGGFPGGGSGQNLSPQQTATLQARRAQNGGGGGGRTSRISPELYDALIKLLQSKK